MFVKSITAAGAAVLLVAPLAAHGGQFLGPQSPPGPIGGPAGPGGLGPGARTGSLGDIGGPTSWMSWWEHNKAPYLRLRDAVHAGVGPSSDGQPAAPTSLAPTESMRRDQILPALRELCDASANRDVQTACLVAMAKIGVDHPEFDLLPILSARLTRGNQEIRETAALSLGLTRRADALEPLTELALDTPAGGRLVRSESVDSRTRAFATYGLGLVAEHNAHLPVQRRVFDTCVQLLDVDNRDVRVAALQSLGLLNVGDAASGGHKRLRWKTLETLWGFFDRDLGRGEAVVQAHVPTAIGRLIGRGGGAERDFAKRQLAAATSRKNKRANAIVQSAIMTLGKIVVASEASPDDAEYVELLRVYSEKGKDELARYFALMALAEIGGDSNRAFLLETLHEGGKATVKPWAALALGVLSFHARAAGAPVDVTVGRALHKSLDKVKNGSYRGAAAVALGLAGYRDAADDVQKLLTKQKLPQQVMRGYLSIGLALMDATEAVPHLRSIVADSKFEPLLLMQASIALGRLGDKEAIDLLSKVLRSGDTNVMRLSGVATAFRYIGDRRAVDRLLQLLGDRGLSKLSRAFVAAALGGVSDRNRLPWNSRFAIGTNYRARVGSLSDGGTGILDIL